MNIEAKIRKSANKKLDKYAKNPYHVGLFNRIPMVVKVVTPISLVLVIGAISLSIVIPNALNNKTNHAQENKGASQASSVVQGESYIDDPSDYQSKNWDEKTITEKFSRVTYKVENKSMMWDATYNWMYNAPLDEQYLDEKFADNVQVEGNDSTPEGLKTYYSTVSLYKIKDFSNLIVAAVKFEEDSHYYVYANSGHTNPDPTIGDLLDLIPLDRVASFDEAFYEYYESDNKVRYQYHGVDKEHVMSIAFNDLTAPNNNTGGVDEELTKTYDQYDKKIVIPTPFPTINVVTGNGASGFEIRNNGFLETTMLNKKQLFYVGIDVYQAFEDYLTSDLMGEKLAN